jgi:hypothetical protein
MAFSSSLIALDQISDLLASSKDVGSTGFSIQVKKVKKSFEILLYLT